MSRFSTSYDAAFDKDHLIQHLEDCFKQADEDDDFEDLRNRCQDMDVYILLEHLQKMLQNWIDEGKVEVTEMTLLDYFKQYLAMIKTFENGEISRINAEETKKDYYGVYYNKALGKYYGQVTIIGKTISTGYADTEEKAAILRDEYIIENFDEFWPRPRPTDPIPHLSMKRSRDRFEKYDNIFRQFCILEVSNNNIQPNLLNSFIYIYKSSSRISNSSSRSFAFVIIIITMTMTITIIYY